MFVWKTSNKVCVGWGGEVQAKRQKPLKMWKSLGKMGREEPVAWTAGSKLRKHIQGFVICATHKAANIFQCKSKILLV